MANRIKWIITKRLLTVYAGGKSIMLRKTDPLYERVISLIVAGKDKAALNLLNPGKRIIKYTNNEFYIDKHDRLFLHGDKKPVHKLIAEKLVQFSKQGLPYKALINFWNNLKQNPDPIVKVNKSLHSIKDQLYPFIMKNDISITEDGMFLAHKAVNLRREDGTLVDGRTNTIINNVGQVVRMKRKDCDPDPRQTCSHGLHVAAFDYAKNSYGGDVFLTVLVNPKDVVAVPTDYDQQKMRTCKYTVVGIKDGEVKKVYLSNSFIVNTTKKSLKKNRGFSFNTMTSPQIIKFVKRMTGKEITMNVRSKNSIVKKAHQIFKEKKLLAA